MWPKGCLRGDVKAVDKVPTKAIELTGRGRVLLHLVRRRYVRMSVMVRKAERRFVATIDHSLTRVVKARSRVERGVVRLSWRSHLGVVEIRGNVRIGILPEGVGGNDR